METHVSFSNYRVKKNTQKTKKIIMDQILKILQKEKKLN